MGRQIVEDIHHYIAFLEGCGYTVSLSGLKDHFSPYTPELIRYDFHPHPICDYLKQNKPTAGRCVCQKRKLEQTEFHHPYYACCYAGIEEYLIPVFQEEQRVICIHVSGYRGKLRASRRLADTLSKRCDERFASLYRMLSEEVPSMEQVLAFVKPLSYMLLMLYESCRSNQTEGASDFGENALYLKALQLIYEDEIRPMTCKRLAQALNYSEAYLRYVFKRAENMTVQEKINRVRLEKAKRLLRGTTASVTEIAFAVGCGDSNYFSAFFKKHAGLSPLAYRKR